MRYFPLGSTIDFTNYLKVLGKFPRFPMIGST